MMDALPEAMNLRLRAVARKFGISATIEWLAQPEKFLASYKAKLNGSSTPQRLKTLHNAHDFIMTARRYERPQWLVDAYEYDRVEAAGRQVEDCESAVIEALARLADAERNFDRIRQSGAATCARKWVVFSQ